MRMRVAMACVLMAAPALAGGVGQKIATIDALVPRNGMTVRYRPELTGNALAASGIYHGILTNGATAIAGTGFVLPGVVSNGVVMPFAAFSGLTSGCFSVWVRTTNDSVKAIMAITKGADVSALWQVFLGAGATIDFADEAITLSRSAPGYVMGWATTNRAALFDGRWHHILLSGDGLAWSIYVDGQSVPMTVGSGSDNGKFVGELPGMDSAVLGGRRINGIYTIGFQGDMADFMLYSRPRSAAEARSIYEYGRNARGL